VGLVLNAGHDLNLDNLHRLLELPGIQEVSIGHALISHALYVGLAQAVKDFCRACGQSV
jgi:pyridoxine 5-phosphate synthase